MIDALKSLGLSGSESVYLIIAFVCVVLYAATFVLKEILKKLHQNDKEYHRKVEERRLNAKKRMEEENEINNYYSTAFMTREDMDYANQASALLGNSYEEDDE